uniref:Uncharacterized protein n=1 Tax=Trepomonas sp. PC1 TaxID=1076344 RepID=A0A146KJY9_9EUKA|eukprot:JAP95751.1 hypothetical protein TPC1_11145 [Trepomonas sp. PC1]
MLANDQTVCQFSYIQLNGFSKTIKMILYWSETLQKHLFATSAMSNKIVSIRQNNKVSINLGKSQKISLLKTIEAEAVILSRDKYDSVYREIFNKHPLVLKFFFKNIDNPDYLIFTIDIKAINNVSEEAQRIIQEMERRQKENIDKNEKECQ